MLKGCFFCYLDFLSLEIHNSQDSRGRRRSILTPLYYYHTLHEHLEIFRQFLERAHLCIKVVTGHEPGTFSFIAQVAKHKATCPSFARHSNKSIILCVFCEIYRGFQFKRKTCGSKIVWRTCYTSTHSTVDKFY